MSISYFSTNTIYCGDCKDVLAKFPNDCVDLIYADPPFFSNQQYEIIWHDGAEKRAFEDRWKGGINNYILWMKERVEQCYRVLKPSGSMYLHCDWHAGAYLKVMMDEIFGSENFIREIIWVLGRRADNAPTFPKAHETLLFYGKTNRVKFHSQHRPYSEKLLKSLKRDEKGWYYTRGARTGRRKLADWEKKSKVGLKTYIDIEKGTKANDVWDDVGGYPLGKEKLGYPTQKPEKLLHRIISASSDVMDIVLDPFCGCGTAIVVAHKLGRRWIGIDVSPTACNLMESRMRKLNVSPNVMGMPLSEEELRKLPPFEFQNWVVQRLFGRVSARKTSDMGIDGFSLEGYPIQVKQSDDIGRNVIDNFETAMRRKKATKGYIVAFSFGSGAWEEIARAKLHDNLEITAITIKELLKRRNQNAT